MFSYFRFFLQLQLTLTPKTGTQTKLTKIKKNQFQISPSIVAESNESRTVPSNFSNILFLSEPSKLLNGALTSSVTKFVLGVPEATPPFRSHVQNDSL